MSRLVLPALLVLLLAGLLWSFLEGRRQALEGGSGDSAGLTAAEDPKLEGRAADPARQPGEREVAEETAEAWQPPPLAPGHAPVTITVRDWRGEPLKGAQVELRPRGRGFTSLQTDELGRAAFPAVHVEKKCDLLVWCYPYMQLRSHRDPDWSPRDVTIDLERSFTITGRIVDEQGVLAPDFRVSFRLPGDAEVHDLLMPDEGIFEISDLGPGKVELWATHREHKRRYLVGEPPPAAGPIEVEAGTKDVVLEVVRGGVLHVQIENPLVDERRGPLTATATAAGSGKAHTAEVDLDGHAVFLGLSPFDTYRVTVYGLGRSQYVDVADLRPGKKTVSVTSRSGAHIRGRFETPAGETLRGGEVLARHATLGLVRGVVSPSAGTFDVEGLPPDTEWTVVLRGTVGAAGTAEVALEATVVAKAAVGDAGAERTLTLQPR